MNQKKLAVVTGGAGFIGSHLVELLIEKDFNVRAIDDLSGGTTRNLDQVLNNSAFDLVTKDICDLDPNDKVFSEVDVVFHLAGRGDIVPSIENPIEYMKVNVQGTVRVLEGARRSAKRFVYAASSSCYGLASVPTPESHAIQPMYPYALSKYLGESAAFHWGKVYGLPVNSICIFNAYGPRVKTKGVYGAVFGVFFKQKLSNKPLTIIGDGTQSRDFVYVTDVAHAFFLASQTIHVQQRFNIGGGKPQEIQYLADLIRGEKVFIPKRPGEPDITFADISKAKSELGWIPRVKFEIGVAKMLENINLWDDAPLWEVDQIAEATKSWNEYLGRHEF